ncbi:MAG: flagellar hook-basal body complex protein FliE [Halobacteriovoraceae bacterium]|nr:flagellar hook-basal body complex protein FliE [Halobacteriovoraceae bacterium]
MSIENVGSMNKLLNTYNAHEWAESAGVQNTANTKKNIFKTTSGPNKTFGELLLDSINKVNELQKTADTSIEKLVSGKTKNIHETMLAVEKADIAFRTMNQLRMKVIDSYREIMKMQV